MPTSSPPVVGAGKATKINLNKRTSDPSPLEFGMIWFRDDIKEYRCAKGGGFASPSSSPIGVGVDSGGCIWNSDGDAGVMYEVDQTGSVISSFVLPDTVIPGGVGVNSGDCIWHAGAYESKIYKLDQTGSIVSSFASPSTSPRGVGVDSGGCIWTTDPAAAKVYQTDQGGSMVSSFASPSLYGLGVDSKDCIWAAGDKTIYEYDQAGSVVSSFTSPSSSPKGVGLDSNDCIWHADQTTDRIYKLDQTGVVVGPSAIAKTIQTT